MYTNAQVKEAMKEATSEMAMGVGADREFEDETIDEVAGKGIMLYAMAGMPLEMIARQMFLGGLVAGLKLKEIELRGEDYLS